MVKEAETEYQKAARLQALFMGHTPYGGALEIADSLVNAVSNRSINDETRYYLSNRLIGIFAEYADEKRMDMLLEKAGLGAFRVEKIFEL